MKITVIIRTFSRPDFLAQALASVELQSHKDWEVIVFDDGDEPKNQSTVKNFRDRNSNPVTYINSANPHYLYKKSWFIAPRISEGEVMIRLDDDDILDRECLEFISRVFTETPELDFSYGTSVFFEGDEVSNLMEAKTPLDLPKTRTVWAGYVAGYPYNQPWAFEDNYFETPRHVTSIIHASKLNYTCIWHPYVMRVSSVLKVLDRIKITSNFVDDLEFLGSLDNLGLGYNKLNKVLTYVRKHNLGSLCDPGNTINGATIHGDLLRVRDEVDFLRPSGLEYQSRIVDIKTDGNYNSGENEDLRERLKLLLSEINSI
jgi:glycosyltransferase involved in cell wall biosynthesis